MVRTGVSIIIPCYNDARYLREAVESVYAQSFKMPFEIIVVDDGSDNPETPEMLEAVAADYPEICVLRHAENLGAPRARNTGLRAAMHPYIFVLDVDNKLSIDPAFTGDGGYIGRSVAMLESDPDVAMVHCQGWCFGAVDGPWDKPRFNEREMLVRNSIDTHAMYRREEALKVGGYDPDMRYCDDWNFALALLNGRHVEGRAAKVITLDEPLFLYRIRDDKSNLSAQSDHTVWTKIIGRNLERCPDLYEKYYPNSRPLHGTHEFFEVLNSERFSLKVRGKLSRLFRSSTWNKGLREGLDTLSGFFRVPRARLNKTAVAQDEPSLADDRFTPNVPGE